MIMRRFLLPGILGVLSLSAAARAQDKPAPPADSPPDAAAVAQDQAPPAPAEAKTAEQKPAADAKPADGRPKPYQTRAQSARTRTDPPDYVKTLSEHGKDYGIEDFQDVDWLDFGLFHRTRLELRDDYYLRSAPENDDEQFLLRSQVYLGIHDIIDPLRFVLEFEDSRQFMSDYPEDTRDVDENDLIQAYGELYFKDALGDGYPLSIRAGRMTLDLIDRKLIAYNNWRNTTDAYDGFRIQLGDDRSLWHLDFFAAMLVEIRQRHFDRPDEERWFYGLVGTWRGWADTLILQPYYIALDQDMKNPASNDRTIHTLGLHGFGLLGKSGFDYDFDTAFQFGEDGRRDHRAFAAYGELGYTFTHPWKPRLSFATSYASGDRDPNDGVSERFDRLRNPRHPPSATDLFRWENTISPKLRLAFQPTKQLRIDGGYGANWLASDNDAWPIPGRRDATGRSGDFVGHDLDVRARYQLNENTELEAGYAYFIPGDFVENTGPADDSDFLYFTVTLHF